MKSHVTPLWRVAAASATCLAFAANAELIHRYSFNGNANDSVGTAHGTARQLATPVGEFNTPAPVQFSDGAAVLDGVSSYIDLPNGIISANNNITLEMWTTWTYTGGNWQRVFDFGTRTIGEDPDGTLPGGNGSEYLFFAASQGAPGGLPRFAANGGSGENPVINPTTPLTGGMDHIVIVYTTNVARVFINGEQYGMAETSFPLSDLDDVNNWLGRSNYGADAMYFGSFQEFRIFNHALTAQEIRASFNANNPDTLNYDAGAVSSVDIVAQTTMLAGDIQTPTLSGEFVGVGPIVLYPPDVQLTSSNPNVVEITRSGNLRAVGAGSATITATLGGQSDTVTISVSASAPYLVHRYSFNEPAGATEIIDSVGNRTGTVRQGTNTLVFDGSSVTFTPVDDRVRSSYIDLGPDLLNVRTNVTIETWFTWGGSNTGANTEVWQRVFDFGDSAKGNDYYAGGDGLGYVFLSPRKGNGNMGLEFRTPAPHASVNVDRTGPAVVGQEVHVVAVFAPRSQTTQLYINGVLVNSGGVPLYNGVPVQFIDYVNNPNNWIGASQWSDPPFKGKINEMRIHEGVLSDLQVAMSAKAGPDTLPPATPGNLVSVKLNPVPLNYIGNLAGVQATFLGTFQNVTDINISAISGVSYSSADTNVFAVNATGLVTPRNIGSANLIASYGGMSATTSVSVLAPVAIRQLGLSTNLHAGSRTFTSVLEADFNGTNGINASAFAGITRWSSDTNIVTISNAGVVNPVQPGTATIYGVYTWVQGAVTNSLTNSVSVTVVLAPGFTRGTILHRYSFNETSGTVVNDLVGTAHGTIINPTGTDFTGNGELVLPGGTTSSTGTGTYVDLPNGLVSGLSSITVEGWVTWQGAADSSWQRIFDIGRSTAVDGEGNPLEDSPGTGASYMFLTPRNSGNLTQFAIKQGTGPETPVLTTTVWPIGTKTHFALVYDTVNGAARLYINGALRTTGNVTLPLSVVEDINVWLGRAQWGGDAMFNGSYDEFRIYDGVLLQPDVAASFTAGPNATISQPPQNPEMTINRVGSNLEITWPESASDYVLNFVNQIGGTWAPANAPTTTSGGVIKATIPVPTGATNAFFQLVK